MDGQRVSISICMGSSCFARGNNDALALLRAYLKARRLEDRVDLKGRLCAGGCNHGPNLEIDGRVFERVEPGALASLLDHHLRIPGASP